MQEKNNLLRVIAGLSACIFGGAQAILIALYPAIALSLKMNLSTILYCASVGTFLFLIGSPFWSNTVDKLSRSVVMLIGTVGLLVSFALVASLISYQLSNLELVVIIFILSQMVYGLIASAAVPAAQAIQTQLVDASFAVRASFIHTMNLNLGRVVGYTLIVLFYKNYLQVLWVYSLLIFIMVLIQILNCNMDKIHSKKFFQKTSWRKEAIEIRWIIAMALLYTCYLETLIFSIADTIKKQFHLDTLVSSGLGSRILLALSIGIFFVQYLGKHFFNESWQLGMMVGVVGLVCGSITLIDAQSMIQVWMAIGGIVLGLGMLPALYLALLHTQDKQRYGKRAGIISAAHTLGYTAGGFLAGYVCNTASYSAGYYLSVLSLIFGFILYKQLITYQYN